MEIEHINPMTNFPCIGFLIFRGLKFYGFEVCSVYCCSVCGRQFFVDDYGNIVL